MTSTVNDTLSIKFPGDKFNDFYLYDLTLTEAISELYRADAIVLSDKAYTTEQLQEALSLKVTITLSQRLSDAKTLRTRNFNGIVTAIEHAGVFYSSDKGDCFSYRLVVEPALSNLCHVIRKAAYNRKTPLDVISEILAEHHIVGNFSEEYISRRPFNSQNIYNQETESDYAFLKRLLAMYGLSFSFRHLASSAKGLAETDVYFSSGDRFPEWTDIVYSDNRKVPSISQFNFRSHNDAQDVWKMDKWKMERRIGIDGVMLQESYPNANVGSPNWKKGLTDDKSRRYTYTKHFHGYIREISKENVDADVCLILNAQYRAFQLAKDVWTGESDNLLLTPCRIFCLSGFYGARNNTVQTGMVTKSVLHCRCKWPAFLACTPDQAGLEEITEIKFNAMNYAAQADDKRFCPPNDEKADG